MIMRVNIIMVSNAGSKMRKRADPLMGEEISRLDVVCAGVDGETP